MKVYQLPDPMPWTHLAGPAAAAEDAAARLDERLARSPIRDGFVARTHFADACACLWLAGDLVHLEDLVLHDAAMDIRAPTHELTRAHAVLRTRRRIAGAVPGWALSPAGLESLSGGGGQHVQPPHQSSQPTSAPPRKERDIEAAGTAGSENDDLASLFAGIDAAIKSAQRTLSGNVKPRPRQPERDPLIHDPDWDEADRLKAWRSIIDDTQSLPPVLSAAIAAHAWEQMEPLQHTPWLGPLLAASLLRSRGKTRSHLACLYLGLRAIPRDRRRAVDAPGLLIQLDAISAAAEAGLKDHDRWLTAHALMTRKLQGRRSSSHLPALIEYVMATPMVSASMIAAELKISQRAAQNLVAELGLREWTGRGRYRAWGIL